MSLLHPILYFHAQCSNITQDFPLYIMSLLYFAVHKWKSIAFGVYLLEYYFILHSYDTVYQGSNL